MPKTKKRRRNSSEANPTYSLLKKALIGGFISTAIYFLFLLLCALAVMNLKVRIVCVRPTCCFEPRIATVELQ